MAVCPVHPSHEGHKPLLLAVVGNGPLSSRRQQAHPAQLVLLHVSLTRVVTKLQGFYFPLGGRRDTGVRQSRGLQKLTEMWTVPSWKGPRRIILACSSLHTGQLKS